MIELQPGDDAPIFKGIDQDGNEITLTDYKGKKVILYFYPKDDTPGCTAEACNFRDNYEDLIQKGMVVIGVSPDTEAKHNKFAFKYDLPFPLIADVEKVILHQYGVWGPKKFMGREYDGVNRSTFIIDEDGKVAHVIKKVKTKQSTEQILALLEIV